MKKRFHQWIDVCQVHFTLQILLKVSRDTLNLQQEFGDARHFVDHAIEGDVLQQIAKEKIGVLRLSPKDALRIEKNRLLIIVGRQTFGKDHDQHQELNDDRISIDQGDQRVKKRHRRPIEFITIAENKQTFTMKSKGFFSRRDGVSTVQIVANLSIRVEGQRMTNDEQ